MEPNSGPRSTRTRRVWFAIIAAVVLLVVLAIWKSARASRTMSAAAVSDEQRFTRTAPGTKAKIVLEIGESTPEGTVRGKLLQKKTEEIYIRTMTAVTVQSNAQTRVVMGKEADLRSGAVIHVTGTARDDRSIAAEQIVILTGCVKIR